MKKYKLLKDLPMMKAGAIFTLKDIGVLYYKDENRLMSLSVLDQDKMKRDGTFDEWFEEIKDEPWKPSEGEQYFYISSESQFLNENCHFTTIFHDDDRQDRAKLSIGNCFKTTEDVDKAVEKLKALKRLRDKGFTFKQWYYLDDIDDESKVDIRIRVVLNYDLIHDLATQGDLSLLFEEGDD